MSESDMSDKQVRHLMELYTAKIGDSLGKLEVAIVTSERRVGDRIDAVRDELKGELNQVKADQKKFGEILNAQSVKLEGVSKDVQHAFTRLETGEKRFEKVEARLEKVEQATQQGEKQIAKQAGMMAGAGAVGALLMRLLGKFIS